MVTPAVRMVRNWNCAVMNFSRLMRSKDFHQQQRSFGDFSGTDGFEEFPEFADADVLSGKSRIPNVLERWVDADGP